MNQNEKYVNSYEWFYQKNSYEWTYLLFKLKEYLLGVVALIVIHINKNFNDTIRRRYNATGAEINSTQFTINYKKIVHMHQLFVDAMTRAAFFTHKFIIKN